MKNILKSLFFFLAAVMAISCEDDTVVDLNAPTISDIQIPETTEAGAPLVISFKLQDETGLGEVRIDIHDDFDGHEHENARIKAAPFVYTEVLTEMSGEKEFTVTETISIPAEAITGPYHIQIRYFDAAGNEGDAYISTFEISSESRSPVIAITNFGQDDELEPTINEDGTKVLYLEGTIGSQTTGGLDEVHIIVEHEGEEGHAHERLLHDGPLYEQEWELNGAATFDLQAIEPVIDLSDAEAGHYELWIMARDTDGNIKIVTREIHVD